MRGLLICHKTRLRIFSWAIIRSLRAVSGAADLLLSDKYLNTKEMDSLTKAIKEDNKIKGHQS